ncbi:MAG: hypothetical protein IJU71_05780 [Selenomonadaceae bacterium]|nr:hypothetical protein [Selenomonadaceae bacterium]
MAIYDWVILFFLAVYFIILIYLDRRGTEIVVPQLDKRKDFTVESRDDKSITLSTVVEFANVGKQSALIVDAIVKPQLPYEQYDGIAVRGKAEVEGKPREDDYFEGLVLEHKQSFNMVAKVTMTARKGMTLNEALSHMVDFPVEIIYREVGRNPMHFSIARIMLTTEELSRVTGVQIITD